MSEAGLRRQSATEVVLNENTDMLMVGQEVWVDGSKKGRIAYLGSVHFSKGEMAGIHLDEPVGKNNGTVGGILYFQGAILLFHASSSPSVIREGE